MKSVPNSLLCIELNDVNRYFLFATYLKVVLLLSAMFYKLKQLYTTLVEAVTHLKWKWKSILYQTVFFFLSSACAKTKIKKLLKLLVLFSKIMMTTDCKFVKKTNTHFEKITKSFVIFSFIFDNFKQKTTNRKKYKFV